MTDENDVLVSDPFAMPVLLTKAQACEWAQVSDKKLGQWLKEPDFPAVRTPRHVRIHARKFEAWLAAKAGGPR